MIVFNGTTNHYAELVRVAVQLWCETIKRNAQSRQYRSLSFRKSGERIGQYGKSSMVPNQACTKLCNNSLYNTLKPSTTALIKLWVPDSCVAISAPRPSCPLAQLNLHSLVLRFLRPCVNCRYSISGILFLPSYCLQPGRTLDLQTCTMTILKVA